MLPVRSAEKASRITGVAGSLLRPTSLRQARQKLSTPRRYEKSNADATAAWTRTKFGRGRHASPPVINHGAWRNHSLVRCALYLQQARPQIKTVEQYIEQQQYKRCNQRPDDRKFQVKSHETSIQYIEDNAFKDRIPYHPQCILLFQPSFHKYQGIIAKNSWQKCI